MQLNSKGLSIITIVVLSLVILLAGVTLYLEKDNISKFTGRVIDFQNDTENLTSENITETDSSGLTDSDSAYSLEIISVSPTNNQEKVSRGTQIKIVFSEDLNESTIPGSFSLKLGNNNISGKILYSNKTLVFIPTFLLNSESEFKVSLTTSLKSISNSTLKEEYAWKFKTESTGSGGGSSGGGSSETPSTPNTPSTPVVTYFIINSTSLENNVKEVPFGLDKIEINFSEDLNESTLNASTVKLITANQILEGKIEYKNKTLTYVPADTLDFNRTYSLILTKQIKSLINSTLEKEFILNFTTLTMPKLSIKAKDGKIAVSWIAPTYCFILQYANNTNLTDWKVTTEKVDYTDSSRKNEILMSNEGSKIFKLYPYINHCDTTRPKIVENFPQTDNNKTNLDINVTVKFSESILRSKITKGTFYVKTNDTKVDGTIIADSENKTFTFVFPKLLDENTTYSVTLTPGIKDIAGNSMNLHYVWNFTTHSIPTSPSKTEPATRFPVNSSFAIL